MVVFSTNNWRLTSFCKSLWTHQPWFSWIGGPAECCERGSFCGCSTLVMNLLRPCWANRLGIKHFFWIFARNQRSSLILRPFLGCKWKVDEAEQRQELRPGQDFFCWQQFTFIYPQKLEAASPNLMARWYLRFFSPKDPEFCVNNYNLPRYPWFFWGDFKLFPWYVWDDMTGTMVNSMNFWDYFWFVIIHLGVSQ